MIDDLRVMNAGWAAIRATSRLIVCTLILLLPAIALGQGSLVVSDHSGNGGFSLVKRHAAAPIHVDANDFTVVHIAADCLAGDVDAVTGVKPVVSTGTAAPAGGVVLIGTIGASDTIDRLIQSGRLDVSGIKGKWETYLITTLSNPLPGVHSALVIVGSDRRGTAYGVFDLSESIGVSPWVWWADVAPAHRDALVIASGAHTEGPPSVKYRGIFINDEDWSIEPWAAKTFEPEVGNIGPKTYAKVFELLLRLKANYLWPAMHGCSKPFNSDPQNKVVADNYAIVMGSSHAEPMLRDNVGEWDKSVRGEWDYDKNRDGILKYWEERLQENGRYENTYTIGMRGIHDSPMPGGGSTADKVARLQRVIADQRDMIARDVNPDVEKVPQIFVPYKEVLTLYQHGLQVPPDVTLVWPDDNHGYIRELSTPEEQKRPGGAGVYYHVSYWGAPQDYLWLCTTPPALIWEEMRKAYDNGARTVWVLNVGGLKKSAIDMEFFLKMAWNINQWDKDGPAVEHFEDAQANFIDDWVKENFGEAKPLDQTLGVLNEYFSLNYPSRPEHLLQAHFTDNYGERAARLNESEELRKRVDAVYARVPPEKRDAFYELVEYPVRCASLMNERWLSDDPAKREWAYEQIQKETDYYNHQLAGGKWAYMMSANPHNQPVFQKPGADAAASPAAANAVASGTDGGIISLDNMTKWNVTGDGSEWESITGLGYSGDAVTLWPAVEGHLGKAELDYPFTAVKSGTANVVVYCIPTHSLHPGVALRYSAAIDGEPPQVVDIDTKEFSAAWGVNVLRGAAVTTTTHVVTAGAHTLVIRPLDPGVIFDKFVIDFGGLLPSQTGPPLTVSRQ